MSIERRATSNGAKSLFVSDECVITFVALMCVSDISIAHVFYLGFARAGSAHESKAIALKKGQLKLAPSTEKKR